MNKSREFFNLNLKRIRKLRGITQAELAEKLNISVTGYQKHESGSSSPGLSTVAKIAKALGVEPWELTLPPEQVEKNLANADMRAKIAEQRATISSETQAYLDLIHDQGQALKRTEASLKNLTEVINQLRHKPLEERELVELKKKSDKFDALLNRYGEAGLDGLLACGLLQQEIVLMAALDQEKVTVEQVKECLLKKALEVSETATQEKHLESLAATTRKPATA